MNPVIAACLKWVDRRPEVDLLTGDVATDPRRAGASDADLAALEWALRLGDGWGLPVVAVTAGSAEADGLLRDAVAAGAAGAVRVEVGHDAPSAEVATALALAVGDAAVVVCGDASVDRGSGAVPAHLAGRLGAAQALGLVGLRAGATPDDGIAAERRLDGGRRERLHVPLPAVLSVEGTLRLRRASLDGVLAAGAARPTVVAAPPSHRWTTPGVVTPYRPRARVLDGPPTRLTALQRILLLTGALGHQDRPETVVLEPGEAADRLLDQLRQWGELG